MNSASTYMQTLLRSQLVYLPIKLDSGTTTKHEEKLLCMLVVVLYFSSTHRNMFLNYTQCIRLYQMPTVAIVTPCVMICDLFVYDTQNFLYIPWLCGATNL